MATLQTETHAPSHDDIDHCQETAMSVSLHSPDITLPCTIASLSDSANG